MTEPLILTYNLDKPQLLKLIFVCSQLKIRCLSVHLSDYAQPIAALAGLRSRVDSVYSGEGFIEEMLVMVNFNNQLLQAFLNALKRGKVPTIALKAVLTPTNEVWDSIRLHDELLREHNAMHGIPTEGKQV